MLKLWFKVGNWATGLKLWWKPILPNSNYLLDFMLGITSIYESMKVYNAENYIAFLTGNLGTSIKSAGLVVSHKVAFVPKPVKPKYLCAAWYQCHFTLI